MNNDNNTVERRPLAGASVWRGEEMVRNRRWIRDWDPASLAALDGALAAVRDRPWDQVTRENFPLTGIDRLLDDIRSELEDGCGMVKLRGLPVERYSEDDLRRLYFGLGSHLAWPVFQNRRGELMRAIRDEGGDLGKRYGQIENAGGNGDKPFLSSYARTLSNGQLRFHTDRTDVVALLCVRQAMAGGISTICSTPMIHNVMLERRPDLLDVLFQDVWRSRHGEETDQAAEVYPLPIFGLAGDKFTSHYSLTYIEAAELSPGVPKLTAQQREAIDTLMALAQELCFEMTLEPGDIQFLNSHVTYHGRTAFTDDATSGHDRLLFRLWLSMPNNRALPAGHDVLWGSIAPHTRRGGIGQVAA